MFGVFIPANNSNGFINAEFSRGTKAFTLIFRNVIESMNNPIHKILISLGGFLFFSVGVFGFIYDLNGTQTGYCGTVDPPFVCGTISKDTNENIRLGKAIFNANCAACHKYYQDATGPALAATDSTVLWKWMRFKNEAIDISKIKDFGIDYHRNTYATTLDSLELAALYEYLDR